MANDENSTFSHVLTLVGSANSAPLEEAHIERVWQLLGITGNTAWLAPEKACDLFFNSTASASQLTRLAHQALLGMAIDVACTPVSGRRKLLFISDMDSTIIEQECIDELGDVIGQGAKIREITARVVNGSMNFAEALHQRVILLKGVEQSLLEKTCNERISITHGARTLVQTMRRNGAYCILVSGGFSYFTRNIAQRIGFHDHQGNDLVLEAGKLTGAVKDPVLGRSAKLRTMQSLCAEKGLALSQVLAAGDGANDIDMIKAAGLGVAFHGSESLRQHSNAAIHHGDLTTLLYFQGFKKSEFVLS